MISKKLKTINNKTALSLIENSKGRYFTVHFKKKDNSNRILTGKIKDSKNIFSKNGYIRFITGITNEFKLIDTRTINKLIINKQFFKVK